MISVCQPIDGENQPLSNVDVTTCQRTMHHGKKSAVFQYNNDMGKISNPVRVRVRNMGL